MAAGAIAVGALTAAQLAMIALDFGKSFFSSREKKIAENIVKGRVTTGPGAEKAYKVAESLYKKAAAGGPSPGILGSIGQVGKAVGKTAMAHKGWTALIVAILAGLALDKRNDEPSDQELAQMMLQQQGGEAGGGNFNKDMKNALMMLDLQKAMASGQQASQTSGVYPAF